MNNKVSRDAQLARKDLENEMQLRSRNGRKELNMKTKINNKLIQNKQPKGIRYAPVF